MFLRHFRIQINSKTFLGKGKINQISHFIRENVIDTASVHVTLVPKLDIVGEQKTKPTQHSVQELRKIGIHPDIILARSSTELVKSNRDKISYGQKHRLREGEESQT